MFKLRFHAGLKPFFFIEYTCHPSEEELEDKKLTHGSGNIPKNDIFHLFLDALASLKTMLDIN